MPRASHIGVNATTEIRQSELPMDPNAMDELRAVAAGLARWYREEMPADEQAVFHRSELADDVRRAGIAVDLPADDSEQPAAARPAEAPVPA